MDLYKEILVNVLSNYKVKVQFSNCKLSLDKIVHSQCYVALMEIKAILADETLSDKECFEKIEEIVCVFEALGSDGGGRHDFI